MNLKQLFQELKRRNVFRVAGVYAITAWLLIQIIATVFPILQLPDWSVTLLTVVILIGFPLALIFAWAFEITPEGIKPTVKVDKTESITSETGKKLNRIAIISLSLFIVFLLTERIFFAESAILERNEADVEAASIAVLPFVNMSGDEENEYFSDGLSEELLNALAKVEDMKVAGRTSSFKFKGQNEDLKIIGEQLGVNHILEGSVRKSGDRVRITAQLVSVEDGYHLWSETYDRELNDIFAIQEEISNQVLQELQIRLIPEEKAELETVPTTDVEAYQLFLNGEDIV
jgi:TolB-like protein